MSQVKQKTGHMSCFLFNVGREGFEPPKAKPADLQSAPVDRLEYRPWSRCAGLNRRPHPYHGCALPTELQRHVLSKVFD